MPTLPIVRITLTPELQEILAKVKKDFPAMKEAEIIKMAISLLPKSYYLFFHDTEEVKKKRKEGAERMSKQIHKMWKGKNKNMVITQEEIDANCF